MERICPGLGIDSEIVILIISVAIPSKDCASCEKIQVKFFPNENQIK